MNKFTEQPTVNTLMLPRFKGSCTLQINEHHDCYQSVEEWDDDQRRPSGERHFEWVSEEERQRAIETDTIVTLQIYPNTPVGFYALAASSIHAINAALMGEQQ